MLLRADRLCAPRVLGKRPSSVRGAVCRRRESCSCARPADSPRQTSDSSLNNLLNAFFHIPFVSFIFVTFTDGARALSGLSSRCARLNEFLFLSFGETECGREAIELELPPCAGKLGDEQSIVLFLFHSFLSAIRVNQYSPSTSRAPSARCERLLLQSSVVCLCLCFCFNFLRLVRQTDVYGKREANSTESNGIESEIFLSFRRLREKTVPMCLRTHTRQHAPGSMVSNC